MAFSVVDLGSDCWLCQSTLRLAVGDLGGEFLRQPQTNGTEALRDVEQLFSLLLNDLNSLYLRLI